MFWTMLLAAWTLLHAYVAWRVAAVPVVARRVPGLVVVAVAAALWASVFLQRSITHDAAGPLAAGFEMLTMTWLAVLFLTATTLLAVDLPTGFGLLLPRLAPALRGWALAAGGVLSIVGLIQGIRAPAVTEQLVELRGLPAELDGTVIVAISDLHLGALIGEGWTLSLVDRIGSMKPDLVVLLGDLFEGHGAPDPATVAALGRLSAPLGVWAVTGNHESHGGEDTTEALARFGLHALRDNRVEVAPGLVLAGVDDRTMRREGPDGDAVSSLLDQEGSATATVLLAHRPLQAAAAARGGAGLMLSGHTHGGQIWPFGALVRTQYPLLSGRYEVEGMPLIVCRGTGTWGPRMRLWQPGEILRITLRTPL